MTMKFKPLAAIIAVVIAWGFSFLSTKTALALYSPTTLGLIRNGLAALFLIPPAIYDGKKSRGKQPPLTAAAYGILALAGFSGVTLYFVCENNGIALVTVSEAAVFTGAIPLLVLLCEWVWARAGRALGRPAGKGSAPASSASGIKKRQWIGAFISIGGVALVSGAGAAISGSVRGYLFMIGAMFCWVAYCFLTGGIFRRASYFSIVFWQTFFGFLGFIPFFLIERISGAAAPLVWPSAAAALHLLFLALICSALCYVFYVYALKKLGAASSSIFINVIPVVTVIAGFFLMGDRLTALQWAGTVCTLTGVYLAVR
jgi:drug/metabolite transporter (DMT)-like permease